MLLTIWRHGEAGSASRDRDRTLTARGKTDLARGATRFQEICRQRELTAPGTILYSPWIRTTQTAQIIASAQAQADSREHPALRPGSDCAAVDAALADAAASDAVDAAAVTHILLVSHQPLVSQLVDHYLGEFGRVPPLAPGAFAILSLSAPLAGCGSLLCWAFAPHYEAGH